jgi:hypothetical protein
MRRPLLLGADSTTKEVDAAAEMERKMDFDVVGFMVGVCWFVVFLVLRKSSLLSLMMLLQFWFLVLLVGTNEFMRKIPN